ncbi:RagB/SusD family nutrient uptake outer membrane protein [Cytophagaceae bacterium DM2B3-1]|uniref:RagB/SusD family nutrient uptake outer membrane protein n=1 Tax=Xanthocytophaga flava TaxID=3048013 RepID=A0ABT7CU13_9BACT|nr:RagB/SusD family nutrient uptake outer membrane protein [Xanthocytophaga flavus]MDJ1472514.1 RagB/SusD family nutrient uptake outer membrane protein [Xanthocytophaga flavus]MDJ1497263.1 RagB/SusD family nutrient uptake outer membrane protein [Xanthocytophaga flavus]
MKINHTFRYILLIAFSLSLNSCKDFLDVQPQSSVSDDQTIVDEASAKTATRGMYRQLASDSYYGSLFQSIGYLSGDNIVWTGSQSIIQDFINHDVKSDNGNIATVWSGIYETINRANHIIAKVPLVTDDSFTEAERNALLGEAYFVRGLCYFDLARTWGGVQIVLTPTVSATDKNGIKRSSLADTYAQVLADLTKAETLLTNTTNRYRATQKTARALLARYYLYQENWAQAEAYADKVIGDTDYELVKPYSAFFSNQAVATKESVFELAYSSTYTNGHRTYWQPPANGGTRQWAPNTTFISLVSDENVGGNRSALIAKTTAGLWYGNMYYRSPATDPAFVIRIAELYLIRSEARAHQDKLADALDDLNAIRDRAGLSDSPAQTQEEILLAIENERRLEFAFEPHRWFDLVRTHRVEAVLGVTNTNKYVLPIPITEVTVDESLEQNTGY